MQGTEKNQISLKERLKNSTDIFKETGHYEGITELELKNKNIIQWELLFSRLQSVAIGSQQVGSKVACSPATREVGESVLGIYTAEGDAIAFSGGIMVHVHTMSRCIKWMIANDYEFDPGLKSGDIFENNDTFIGGVHIPDIMDITPIFYNDELIGWTGMVTHSMEVGGVTPGSMPVLASERFTEGLIICAEKVGENDSIYRNYEIRCERSVRSPAIWIMDTKARVTGALMARDEILKSVEEFGLDYYKLATKEYIETARLAQLEKVKTMLLPGVYKEITCTDQMMEGEKGLAPMADGDVMNVLPLEMKIDGTGKMTIDFDGIGSWRYWSANATPAAIEGGLFVSISQLLNYDGRLNHGSYLGTELLFPYGSCVWPDNQYVATANAWNTIIPVWNNWYRMMARSFFNRGFVEESFLMGALTPIYDAGGYDQYGNVFGGSSFELAAQGSGARGMCDGIDTGYVVWNPESDMGNAEIWEMVFPQLYLGRNILPNSHGFGKYRGGSGWQSLLMTHNTNNMVLTSAVAQAKAFDHQGIFGGYPGKSHYVYGIRDNNLKELIDEQLPLPKGEGDNPKEPELLELVKGDVELRYGNMTMDKPMSQGDLFLMQYRGAGGLGDPLDREIELIQKDLENGYVTKDIMENVCGVVFENSDSLRISVEKTNKHRSKLKKERISRGVPTKEWFAQEKSKILELNLPRLILQVYKDMESHSEKWINEFREFWELEKSFTFNLDSIESINSVALRSGKSTSSEMKISA